MSSGEDPGRHIGPRPDRGSGLTSLLWSFLLNTVLILAFVVGVIPLIAIVHGFSDLVVQSKIRSGADWVAYGFAFTGLFLGAVFFTYAIKYYVSTAIVLLTTLVAPRRRNGRGNGNGGNGNHGNGSRRSPGLSRTAANGNGNGNGFRAALGHAPFVSVHVAAYNEKRVIERLLVALEQLDYPE